MYRVSAQLLKCSIQGKEIKRTGEAIGSLKEQKRRSIKFVRPGETTVVNRNTMSDTLASNSSGEILSQMFTIFLTKFKRLNRFRLL